MKCDWGRGLGAFVQVDELAAFVLHGDGVCEVEGVRLSVFATCGGRSKIVGVVEVDYAGGKLTLGARILAKFEGRSDWPVTWDLQHEIFQIIEHYFPSHYLPQSLSLMLIMDKNIKELTPRKGSVQNP